MRLWLGAVALAAGGMLQAPVSSAPLPSADELARAIQAHYDSVRDFTADFTNVYAYDQASGGLFKPPRPGRGVLRVKKPGRMRWTYTQPEKEELIADGTLIYWYVPKDKQVLIWHVPAGNQVAVSTLFLAGRGNLVRDFTASLPKDQAADRWRLTLVPRERQEEFASLVLTVDRKTLALRRLDIADRQGGTNTFEFTSLKENIGVPESAFTFTPPAGTEVQWMDGGRP